MLPRFARRKEVDGTAFGVGLDLMGLQLQVGVVYPEPRFQSGTTPDEYIKAPGHRYLTTRGSIRPSLI